MIVQNSEKMFGNSSALNINISVPKVVGYMSVDVNRQYHSNLSQLKFLNFIPNGRLHLDLNHNIDSAVKRTTDDNDEKINLLLNFLLDRKNCLSILKHNRNDPLIITYRRTLISIMHYGVGSTDPCCIIATLYKGSIYLCSLETDEKKLKRQSRTKREETFCAWGYKFEQYMLSDLPNLNPNIEKPVIENEEFSMFYYSSLGRHELLYGAQIDGLLATDGNVSNPPSSPNYEDSLKYLCKNNFVELKTHREMCHPKQEQSFRRYKLFLCWCQCYLAKLKGVLMGYRNDEGIIKRLQWFNTEDIVKYCKNEWSPQRALQYLDYFLSYMKDQFIHQLHTKYGNSFDLNNCGPISLRFEVDLYRDIKVSSDISQNDVILPDWYLESNKS